MQEQKTLYTQKLRYKYLAYCVVRDAVGFYFGIPKFFETLNSDDVYKSLLDERINSLKSTKCRELSEKEQLKCEKLVRRHIDKRVCELETDYKHCVDVLFNDNIWLQLLDLQGEFLKNYLDSLPEEVKVELAVVPKWSTRDHSLGRTYINDDFNFNKLHF